jgi:hypothetical protein
MFPLPKGRKHNNGYNSNRTKSIKIKMTVEPDSLTRLSNKILIVDDHPLLFKDTEWYHHQVQPEKYEFHILEAKDCESAYHLIVNPERPLLTLRFLDISMPSMRQRIYSGET